MAELSHSGNGNFSSAEMSNKFTTDELKYEALIHRNPEAEGEFIYCALSTLIFCRPTCSSRLPLRKNVIFCNSTEEAIEMNFRPCRRCKPDISVGWNKQRDIIEKACYMIAMDAASKGKLDMEAIINKLEISKWHFYRTFKNYTGKTPRKFYYECLQNANPLISNPLPVIETKKNLRKRKIAAEKLNLENATSRRKMHNITTVIPEKARYYQEIFEEKNGEQISPERILDDSESNFMCYLSQQYKIDTENPYYNVWNNYENVCDSKIIYDMIDEIF